MSVAKIEEYLNTHFAGHDIPTLMQHFKAAVQEEVAAQANDVRGQIGELRAEVQDCRDAVAHQSKGAAQTDVQQAERAAAHVSRAHQQPAGHKNTTTKAKGD